MKILATLVLAATLVGCNCNNGKPDTRTPLVWEYPPSINDTGVLNFWRARIGKGYVYSWAHNSHYAEAVYIRDEDLPAGERFQAEKQ